MDFVSDALANGRRLKCLTVADDFTHECVDITVDHGISGVYVVRVLDQAARFRGYPRAMRTHSGPEFTSRAFIAWTQQHGIQNLLIEPGRPMQNGDIESFNGKFRDECLNEHWFTSLVNPATSSPSAPRLQPGATAQQLRTHPAGPVCRQPPNPNQPHRSTLQPRTLPVTGGTATGGRSSTIVEPNPSPKKSPGGAPGLYFILAAKPDVA